MQPSTSRKAATSISNKLVSAIAIRGPHLSLSRKIELSLCMYKRLNFIIEAQGLTYDTTRHQNVHQVGVDVHSVFFVGVARFF